PPPFPTRRASDLHLAVVGEAGGLAGGTRHRDGHVPPRGAGVLAAHRDEDRAVLRLDPRTVSLGLVDGCLPLLAILDRLERAGLRGPLEVLDAGGLERVGPLARAGRRGGAH